MKPCPYCGTPMSSSRRVQCGSSDCRKKYDRDRNKRFRDQFRGEHGRPYFYDRRKRFAQTCIQCGKTWKAFSKAAKYCSFTCQAAHQHGESRERKLSRAEKKRASAQRRLDRAASGKAGRTPWVTGECSECDVWFSTPLPLACTCSPECAEARKKKRHREAAKRYWGRYGKKWISAEDRLAIYERDGWTCQLCLDPVDPDLHHLDAWAATLDHIVCRSWTDEPDHSPENLRLAHRWCNSVRGDESHYDPAVLAAA